MPGKARFPVPLLRNLIFLSCSICVVNKSMVSIVIPAYNEEAVIGRTLSHLLQGTTDEDRRNCEIIVSCNGCKDRTAEIARSFGPPVKVVETDIGSKTVALNNGDAAATMFPRIYLDADILMNFESVKAVVRALSEPGVLAAAPRMRVDLTGRPWAIRAFYKVWLRTPYHLKGMIGSGVYALSQEGRNRFKEFPRIIADDGYVYALFGPDERKTVEEASFTIVAPKDLASLLRIKTRATLGMKELKQRFPDVVERQATLQNRSKSRYDYMKLLAQPHLWPELGVYSMVKAIASLRAKQQLKTLSGYKWERDESSRV